MINKTYEFSLDIKNNTNIPTMEFYKGDTEACKMLITIRNEYQLVNLEGFTIVCDILKADSTKVQNLVDIIDKEKGLIAVNLTSQALASTGNNNVQLSIYEGLKRLSIHEFSYIVKDTLVGEQDIISTNEYSVLTQLISDVQGIENILNSSELTRVTNEATRIDNEGTRQLQEEARQTLKGQMDTLKSNLESLKTNLETLNTNASDNENARISNEQARELLKTDLESLKSTLEALNITLNDNEVARGNTFNTKINDIDNKITDVEARCTVKENAITNKITEANTTIDNVNIAKNNTITATNNANTKISETEAARQNAINTINNLVAQFNALAPANSTNAEVQLARTDINGKTYASLQERLLADNKQQNIMYADVSGTYITSDSVDGWLKNVVIEGNTYQDPAVLSTIKSVGTKLADGRFEIPLLSCGKNLCGQENKLSNVGIDTNLKTIVQSQGNSSVFIKLKANTDYVISFNKDVNRNILGFTNSIPLAGGVVTLGTTTTLVALRSYKFNSGSNKYAIFYYNNIYSDFDIQIEEGTVATTYEAYQSNKLTILSDYLLGKIGTVADRILQLSDGRWYIEKNIDTVILNGSEGWSLVDSLTLTNTLVFNLNNKIAPKSVDCLSDKFKTDSINWTNLSTLDSEMLQVYTDKNMYIRISKTKCTDLATFKTWLSNNNTIIKYQAVTPTYIPLSDDQQVSLKTFATKTNILSLCEIEPTIKASVPKSTSASINGINEKVTAISNDLARVKKLEDATTTSVISDNSFVNISDSTNGYLSDLKLEGKTLNQIVTNGNFASTTGWLMPYGTGIVSNNEFEYTVSSLNTSARIEVSNDNAIAGHKYFVTGYVKPKYSNSTKMQYGANTITFANPTPNIWNKVYAIVTASDSTRFRFYHATDTNYVIGDKIYFKEVMALDLTALGMANYTADQINSMLGGYFEGLKSVGSDVDKLVVSSVSQNLFDVSTVVYNKGVNATTGAIVDTAYWCYSSQYIRVEKGKTYYINRGASVSTTGTSDGYIYVYQYNLDKSFNTARLDVGTTNNSFTATIDGYVRLAMKYSSVVNFSVSTSVITYKPYETDKKQILFLDNADSTWKKPTLRGIWSNSALVVGDSIYKNSNNKYYYNLIMGETKYVGTETFVLNDSTTYANTIWISIPRSLSKASSKVICDKFNTVTTKGDYEGIFIDATNVYIGISKTKATDLATAKTWIVANNITIVYELATPLTYECTPLDLSSFDSETNYLIESGVLSPRSTIKCQNFIGSIVNNLKEQVSVLQNKVYDDNMLMKATLINHEARMVAKGI